MEFITNDVINTDQRGREITERMGHDGITACEVIIDVIEFRQRLDRKIMIRPGRAGRRRHIAKARYCLKNNR